jgi:DNA-directed RNA polymerase subunit K/omega
VSYRRRHMAESERARQLRQYAERLVELRRYL